MYSAVGTDSPRDAPAMDKIARSPSTMDSAPFAGLRGFVGCRIHAGHKQASSDLVSTGLDRGETRLSRLMMEIARRFFNTAISYYLIVDYVDCRRCWTSPLRMV